MMFPTISLMNRPKREQQLEEDGKLPPASGSDGAPGGIGRYRVGLEVATEQDTRRPARAEGPSEVALRKLGLGLGRAHTIPGRLQQRALITPDAPAYHEKVQGEWRMTSWSGFWDGVQSVSRSLLALGVGPGDICTIYSANRPEWTLFDLGLMNVGSASAGAYPDLGPKTVAHIVKDSESKILVVEDLAMWGRIKDVEGNFEGVEHIVFMGAEKAADPRAKTWAEFLHAGADVSDPELEARMNAIAPDQLATLIYTSGTTGSPKGAMISHRNLAFAGETMKKDAQLTKDDRIACYLMLGHIAERVIAVSGPITAGASVFYSSHKAIASDLKDIRPTVFFAVPDVWEKFASKIESMKADRANQGGPVSWLTSAVSSFSSAMGRKASEQRNRGETPSGLLHAAADKVVFSKVRALAGLDCARICVSGAAPLADKTAKLFESLDIQIMEAYAQTEGTGIGTENLPGAAIPGTIGRAATGVKLRLAEDGELMMSGPNVFMGYWKNEEATAKTLQNGWLLTGDLVAMDARGFVTYVDRKGNFKLANGTYLNAEPIQRKLKGGVIGKAIVVGAGKKRWGMAIELDPALAKRAAAANGAEADGPLAKNPSVIEAIEQSIAEANKSLEGNDRIRRYTILDRELERGADGEIGPTGKVLRKAVEAHFAHLIDPMLADEEQGAKS